MRCLLVIGIAVLTGAQLPAQLPDSLARRVDSVFVALDKPTSPGCALGIYNAGEIVYTRGYGSANLEHGIPNTPRTVFDLGSTSKQFTAMSVTLLEQDGKPVGWQGIARDVAERKRAEDEIRQLNADLELRVVERTSELAASNKYLEAFS